MSSFSLAGHDGSGELVVPHTVEQLLARRNFNELANRYFDAQEMAKAVAAAILGNNLEVLSATQTNISHLGLLTAEVALKCAAALPEISSSEILQTAAEHNMIFIAQHSLSISLSAVKPILHGLVDDAEQFVVQMIVEGKLKAQVDDVNSIIDFEPSNPQNVRQDVLQRLDRATKSSSR